MERITSLIAAVPLACGVLIGWAVGQAQPPKSAEPVAYKYTTETPPGIASPDKVETRFGALNFFDGFPDKPSVEKLYDNLDFQRRAGLPPGDTGREPGGQPQRHL